MEVNGLLSGPSFLPGNLMKVAIRAALWYVTSLAPGVANWAKQ